MDERQAATDASGPAQDLPNASPFSQRARKALVRRHSSSKAVDLNPRNEVEQKVEIKAAATDEKSEIMPAATDDSSGSKGNDTPIRRRADGSTKRREGLIQRLTEKKRPSSAVKERPVEEGGLDQVVSEDKPEIAVVDEKATGVGVGRRLQRLGQWKRSHSSSKQRSEAKDLSMTVFSQESTGLDFRPVSVSDLGEEVKLPEASWDVNKVYFNEFDDGKKKDDSGIDMFEANVVTEADVSLDMVQRMNLAHLPDGVGLLLAEEKKEKDISPVSNVEELDPLGWPLRPEGLQDPLPQEELSEPVELEDIGASDDDGDNLLDPRSRSVDEEDNDEPVLGGDRVTKEERIAMYETRDGDDSSSGNEGLEELADDASANEDVEVGYVSQESDDEKEDFNFTSFDSGSFPASFASVPVAQFAVQPRQEVQSKEGLPPRSSASSFPPPPPPPPPRRKSSKRSKSKSSGKGIPLLAPPPPEKLKKWEERKSRQILNALPDLSPLAGSPEEQRGDANCDPSKEDTAVKSLATKTPNTSLGSSPGTSLTPASSSVVIQDTKLAEKVDHAISAAALKFEEHISNSPPRPSHSENPPPGAFSPWRNKEGDSASSVKEMCSADEQAEALRTDRDDVGGVDTGIEVVMKQENTISSRPTVARQTKRYHRVPQGSPSPFEATVHTCPTCLSHILACLGDPVVVSRVKMVNRACKRYVETNEYALMRDAVRTGGMSMNVRPYFWLWVTLEKGKDPNLQRKAHRPKGKGSSNGNYDLEVLERIGREGPWHSVIGRDVSRAFGNLPPHKTGARLRTDSIVRALVTWGKSRIMKRGVKGEGDAPPPSRSPSADSEEVSLSPTDTVSDWGGVAPVGSFTSSVSDGVDSDDTGGSRTKHSTQRPRRRRADEDLALSGNTLTDEAKAALQRKLSFILHALAAAHQDVGYCQGMDYVVAHLLRILQETILWKAANGTLYTSEAVGETPRLDTPPSDDALLRLYEEFDSRMVVEETCFRVMDSFFTTYGLQHFFWPELRCLKTCCLVFEKLIQIKLPVLADHFEHHELNVGLFALGWFQTLFLYLPSMPSATVCHMWDIWLVERSFKIFFRVGTAILFLSQPILLNHELEGMMSYLNTFPDATLLSPDILIACALQIKITNSLLMKVEQEVTSQQPGS